MVRTKTKRKKTPAQQMQQLAEDIRREQSNWRALRDHGGQDPHWPDGCNMNLTRNHMIYFKRKMTELHDQHKVEIPAEYFTPLPPKVDDNYMAPGQKDRENRLRVFHSKLTHDVPEYQDYQMELF